MASIASALSAFVMTLIMSEAPSVRDSSVRQAKYTQDVITLVDIHDEVSDGRLINHDMDMLILTAVNYRESRLKNPSVDGDCHYQSSMANVPSANWPKGYKPTFKLACNAIGPMQIAKGNLNNLPTWAEVSTEFQERGWSPSEPAANKQNPMTLEDLRDPKTNIRIAYAELEHWKNECRGKDGADAPIGVWFTAYRYGHCPSRHKSGEYFVDGEAKARCKLVSKMVDALAEDAGGLPPVRCTY